MGGSEETQGLIIESMHPLDKYGPLSWIQAYIAYLLGSKFCEVNFRYHDFCELRHNGVLRSTLPRMATWHMERL